MDAAIDLGCASNAAPPLGPSRAPLPRYVRLGIVPKILSAVVLLACTAAAIGWLGFDAIRTYGVLVGEINNASERAVLGEQINGLVLNVVMDSRGLYMAKDRSQIEDFATPLLANLVVLESKMAQWVTLLPARRHELDVTAGHMQEFVRFRRNLVRLAREDGPEKARAAGKDLANRANRANLNTEISELAAGNAGEVAALTTVLEAYRASSLSWILGITFAGVAVSLGLAVVIVLRSVTRPLARITAAIRQLAQGDMSVTVPGRGRGDEIGTIAVAVEVFKAGMIEVEQLRAELEADRMRGLANAAVEGLLVCDGDAIASVNNSFCALVGMPSAEALACDLATLLPDDAARAELRETSGRAVETVLRRAGGDLIPVEAIRRPVDFVGKPHDAIAIRDLRDRKKAEDELRQAQSFLNTVIESVPAVIVVKDTREFRYVLINRAAEEFYGISRDEVIGKTVHDIYPKETADFISEKYRAWSRNPSAEFYVEHEVLTPKNGARRVIATTLPIRHDSGAMPYVLTVLEDVTERRRIEGRIAHLAYHDALTDLHNRAALADHLATMLERGTLSGDGFAVLCIDLDHFKQVNDVCGHAIGDTLLREVAKRLQAAADGAFIARLGGDEFTLVISDAPQPAGAAALAERLLAAVADEFVIGEHRLRIGLSIGVAVYPTDGTDATALVGNADAALYRAKAEGRGVTHFFEHNMDMRLRQRRALLGDLRTAIERGQISIHYQPQAVIDGEIFGFEALARWHHPVHGMVSPATFIPLAEESGLIMPMGEWVLREACREAASWTRPLQIAVNLSPVQFQHGDLPGLVHSILLSSGLDPDRLELEITEGVLIGDSSRALSILRRLKSLGVRIAMDDFGTGYSSLSYLQSFPFDKIKIDKSFITNVKEGTQSAAIVRAIIGLGHGLDVPIIAEGVEIADQVSFLRREGCKEVQGYLVGRPCPIADYAAHTHGEAAVRTSVG